MRPTNGCRPVGDGLRAVGIVDAEQRGLSEDIGAAEAGRMLVVAFNLRGTAEMAFDQQRAGVSASVRPSRNTSGGRE